MAKTVKRLASFYEWALIRTPPGMEPCIADDGENLCIGGSRAEVQKMLALKRDGYAPAELRAQGKYRIARLLVREVP